ncbi:MAG: NAD(P)/FAD-dependent oxidoreductase [Bacteroidetes bacterium]|nr:NAD(P)/FAD-dependent oxidoreductase [Bacteroidota bacterium]
MISRLLPNRFDVAIIGAGPSGSLAAMNLAGKGIKTLILEKETLPRYKACGGGLVYRTRNWLKESAGLEIPDSIIESESFQAGFRIHANNLMFEVKRNVPIITMVMREQFDYWLTMQAVNQGAELVDNTKVLSIKKDIDFLITTTGGVFCAPVVVLASGALGKILFESDADKQLITGFHNYREMMPALEAEIPMSDNELFPFARFDLDMNKGGYGWVFPKKTSYSVGLVVNKKSRTNLNRLLGDYLRLLKLDQVKPTIVKGHTIPYQAWANSISVQGILKTGDAMGLADPVVGEGLSNALQSGWMAAEAIIESGLDPRLSEKVYLNKLGLKILPQLKIATRLAGILYNQPKLSKMIFRTKGQEIAENFTEVFLGNRDYPTEKEVFSVLRKLLF